MSTVPGPDTPAPANNAKTLTIGDGSALYVRPTAGGNATGDASAPSASKVPAPVQPAPKEGAHAGGPIFKGATIMLSGTSGAGDLTNGITQ